MDQIEPIKQPVGDLGVQKTAGNQSRRPIAVQAPGMPVEQGGSGRIGRHSGACGLAAFARAG